MRGRLTLRAGWERDRERRRVVIEIEDPPELSVSLDEASREARPRFDVEDRSAAGGVRIRVHRRPFDLGVRPPDHRGLVPSHLIHRREKDRAAAIWVAPP